MIPSGWINSSSSLLGEGKGEEDEKERGGEGRRKRMNRRIRREQRGGGELHLA